MRDPAALSRSMENGRLGYLLYKRALTRRLIVPTLARLAFATSASAEHDPVAELPAMLDRVDAWISDGVLGGDQLNAADYMVAPSLALILYQADVLPIFRGRPALELVDRLLPEPT